MSSGVLPLVVRFWINTLMRVTGVMVAVVDVEGGGFSVSDHLGMVVSLGFPW